MIWQRQQQSICLPDSCFSSGVACGLALIELHGSLPDLWQCSGHPHKLNDQLLEIEFRHYCCGSHHLHVSNVNLLSPPFNIAGAFLLQDCKMSDW